MTVTTALPTGPDPATGPDRAAGPGGAAGSDRVAGSGRAAPPAPPFVEAGWVRIAATTVAGEPLAVWASPATPVATSCHARSVVVDGPGPVVVAAHGMEDTWRTWAALAGLIGPARVYALDLPWRSGSDYRWAADRPPAGWLAEALALVPEPADVLLAHSFGAGAALAHLADGYAAGAAVLAAPFYRPGGEPLDEAGRAEALAGFVEVVGDGLRARMGPRAAKVDPEVFDAMRDRLLDRVVPVAGDPFLEAFVRSGRLDLRGVTVPTLVLAGSADVSLTPARAAALAAAMPAADVRQRDAYTHFCQLEQAADVAAEVRGFFDEHLRGRSER